MALLERSGRSRRAHPAGLLIEGDTCWRRAHAARAAVLIDAASYFEALRASLLAAKRSVMILGWELHSRMRLEGAQKPTDGAPAELGRLLRWLLKRRPQLTLKILLWNHPVVYAVHRELFPRWIFGPRVPDRVEIMLDSHLPAGASHHEKLVIIDDEVAYCGGIDLTVRRWDVAAHHPAEPRRRDSARRPYVPLHDVQIVVEGAAASALGARARARWRHAGGKPIEPLRPARKASNAWPQHVKPDFTDLDVGIMRTVAALEEREEEIREIERATVAAIGSAERFIYIENQYVTSKTACEALVARMRSTRELEVVVVTTREPGGWLEAGTMGVGRQHFMAAFDDASLTDRIRFVAPLARCTAPTDDEESSKIVVDGTLSIHVHAKVLIVDDKFLRIGSSNLNNRSMGYDTECDLAIEGENAAQRESIASVRNRLIAEHWGSDEKAVQAALSRA
ncbi:MAG TPA: phospholipase D-like domain-containing protein, partial [Gammaproteobacteria bacterium]